MKEEQARDEATVVGRANLTKEDGLEGWLPSGTHIQVKPHEVLLLRDMCNNYMSHFGGRDVFGRTVEWQRPHPAGEVEHLGDATSQRWVKAPASGTEPSSTEQQDAS